jgi:hypothetical protein
MGLGLARVPRNPGDDHRTDYEWRPLRWITTQPDPLGAVGTDHAAPSGRDTNLHAGMRRSPASGPSPTAGWWRHAQRTPRALGDAGSHESSGAPTMLCRTVLMLVTLL